MGRRLARLITVQRVQPPRHCEWWAVAIEGTPVAVYAADPCSVTAAARGLLRHECAVCNRCEDQARTLQERAQTEAKKEPEW